MCYDYIIKLIACRVTISPQFKNGDAILLQDYSCEDCDLGKSFTAFLETFEIWRDGTFS